MSEIRINSNDCGQRVDRFIKKTFPNFPQSAIYKAIRTKKIKINKSRCAANSVLHEGDLLEIFGFGRFLEIKKSDINFSLMGSKGLNVVYEDENLVVVNKPRGISSHPSRLGQDSVVSRVLGYLTKKNELFLENENSFVPALCNRLDTNTAGLIVAAKNAMALRGFNELLKHRKIFKIYLCLVEGVFEKQCDVLVNSLKKIGRKNVVVVGNDKKNSKIAVLKYFVEQQLKNHARLKIFLYTGRSHQIRKQLSLIGHPILGDVKYGSNFSGRLMLCSVGLSFKTKGSMFDYLDGKTIEIEADF